MRVARKVMGPALDFIHEKRKQELQRIEETDKVGGKIELFPDCAFKVLLIKWMRTHCLQRQVKHAVNHYTTQYCTVTIKYT